MFSVFRFKSQREVIKTSPLSSGQHPPDFIAKRITLFACLHLTMFSECVSITWLHLNFAKSYFLHVCTHTETTQMALFAFGFHGIFNAILLIYSLQHQVCNVFLMCTVYCWLDYFV